MSANIHKQTSNALAQTSIILIDNLDSFSYNLVDEIRTLGANMSIFRNTANAADLFELLKQTSKQRKVLLIISPGPGAPADAGCVPQLLEMVKGQFPVLGICLGHQAIVEAYQGKVTRAPEVMHGKSSLMHYQQTPETKQIFEGLSNPLSIARYHSLAASEMPDCLQVVADIAGLPMAVLHADDKMLGLQFHPESILTRDGSQLLKQCVEFLLNDASKGTV